VAAAGRRQQGSGSRMQHASSAIDCNALGGGAGSCLPQGEGPTCGDRGTTHHDNRHFALQHFVEAAGGELQHGPILLVQGRGTSGQKAHSQRQGAAEQPQTPHGRRAAIHLKDGNQFDSYKAWHAGGSALCTADTSSAVQSAAVLPSCCPVLPSLLPRSPLPFSAQLVPMMQEQVRQTGPASMQQQAMCCIG
jgi:hypothetical protein